MRFRYLIERNGPLRSEPFHLTQVDSEGEAIGSSGLGDFGTVPDAKLCAEALADPVVLAWKEPPRGWQPDAVCVSQFLEDE